MGIKKCSVLAEMPLQLVIMMVHGAAVVIMEAIQGKATVQVAAADQDTLIRNILVFMNHFPE